MRKLLFLVLFFAFYYLSDGAAECSSQDVADSVESIQTVQEIEAHYSTSYHCKTCAQYCSLLVSVVCTAGLSNRYAVNNY